LFKIETVHNLNFKIKETEQIKRNKKIEKKKETEKREDVVLGEGSTKQSSELRPMYSDRREEER
jgi:hypothetical protein